MKTYEFCETNSLNFWNENIHDVNTHAMHKYTIIRYFIITSLTCIIIVTLTHRSIFVQMERCLNVGVYLVTIRYVIFFTSHS